MENVEEKWNSWVEVNRTIRQGVELLWENKLAEGELLFESLSSSHPRYALHYAEAAFLRGLLTGDRSDVQEAYKRIDNAIDVATNASKPKGTSFFSKLFGSGSSVKSNNSISRKWERACSMVLAEALLVKSVLQLLMGNQVKGTWTLRKSWKQYQEIERSAAEFEFDLEQTDFLNPIGPKSNVYFTNPVAAKSNNYSTNGSTSPQRRRTAQQAYMSTPVKPNADSIQIPSSLQVNVDPSYQKFPEAESEAESDTELESNRSPQNVSVDNGLDLQRPQEDTRSNHLTATVDAVVTDTVTDTVTDHATVDYSGVEIFEDMQSCLQFGLGFFYLWASMVPGGLHSLVKMAGFVANRGKGLTLLRDCVKDRGLRAPFALLSLLFYLLVYVPDFAGNRTHRLQQAELLLTYGNQMKCKGLYLKWMESYLYLKRGHVDKAIAALQEAVQSPNQMGIDSKPPFRICYELGWCYFVQLDWQKTCSYLLNLIGVDNTDNPRPMCALQLGVAYLMQNDPISAVNWFSLASSMAQDTKFDRLISRLAKRYSVRRYWNLLPFELIYLLGQLTSMDSSWLNIALESINRCATVLEDVAKYEGTKKGFSLFRKSNIVTLDEASSFSLLQGVVFKELGNVDAAITCLESVTAFEAGVKYDTYLIPHALYELGTLLLSRNELKKAEAVLRRIDGNKKFDFRRTLMLRVRVALDELHKAKIEELTNSKKPTNSTL
eukprot:GILJ01012892.1.p1 GENE.GILJ01012892.1~~GILJ01012892.1.p1  ORF type:complete len:726 (+),score=102.20 GILJ01012892.1:26-2179(+)